MATKRVYGPVPSRRFGLSLGVDLVPYKTCSYDCCYCQVGPTTCLTDKQRDFYPLELILQDVGQALEQGPKPDVISLAGSGDPCLYASLKDLIVELHRLSDAKIVLITNGALLHRPQVRQAALAADILAPSLDAADQKMFERVNQPVWAISFEQMLAGLTETIGRHTGLVRLELMLIQGVNDSQDHLDKLQQIVHDLSPDQIDINTPVRPAPKRKVSFIPPHRLLRISNLFGSTAAPIAQYQKRKIDSGSSAKIQQRVLEMLARRPCSFDDLLAVLDVVDTLESILQELIERGLVEEFTAAGGQTYYYAAQ